MKTKTQWKAAQLARRHRRVRKKVSGSDARPRLVVHRSLKHIQAHLVDDVTGRVLLGITSASPAVAEAAAAAVENGSPTKRDRSRAAGKLLAERAKASGVERVVFDRGGYIFHGRVAAFAQGAREAGLEF